MKIYPPQPDAPLEKGKFKKGTLVQLRSGGLAMTVERWSYAETDWDDDADEMPAIAWDKSIIFVVVVWHDMQGRHRVEEYRGFMLIPIK